MAIPTPWEPMMPQNPWEKVAPSVPPKNATPASRKDATPATAGAKPPVMSASYGAHDTIAVERIHCSLPAGSQLQIQASHVSHKYAGWMLTHVNGPVAFGDGLDLFLTFQRDAPKPPKAKPAKPKPSKIKPMKASVRASKR